MKVEDMHEFDKINGYKSKPRKVYLKGGGSYEVHAVIKDDEVRVLRDDGMELCGAAIGRMFDYDKVRAAKWALEQIEEMDYTKTYKVRLIQERTYETYVEVEAADADEAETHALDVAGDQTDWKGLDYSTHTESEAIEEIK